MPSLVSMVAAQKSVVFLVDRIVDTSARQMPILRLLALWLKPKSERVAKGDGVCAYLIVALVVGEKEELVLLDRPADGAAILSAHKEGVLQALASCAGSRHSGLRRARSLGRLKPEKAAILWSRKK